MKAFSYHSFLSSYTLMYFMLIVLNKYLYLDKVSLKRKTVQQSILSDSESITGNCSVL